MEPRVAQSAHSAVVRWAQEGVHPGALCRLGRTCCVEHSFATAPRHRTRRFEAYSCNRSVSTI
eukprot:6206198-Pleurochrysis_carterae.AAC.1